MDDVTLGMVHSSNHFNILFMITHEILNEKLDRVLAELNQIKKQQQQLAIAATQLQQQVNDDIKAFCINVVADIFSESLSKQEKQNIINRLKI